MRVPNRVRVSAGFSMIEMLIAATLLLFISLGLIPLFARSIRDNQTGSDFTQATNGNRSRLEESLQLPFNNQTLEVPVGQPQGQVVESWAQGNRTQTGDANEGWWPGAPSGRGLLLWTRTTNIRQYNVNDLEDGELDTPQPGGTEPVFVHLKEVEVVLESEKESNAFGTGRRVTFRVLKPF
ncbi:MAG TPA: hypothetical protein VJ885_10665 [Thermoanaerobaculia bacterium]|nr:hypothetical protein [Thermoanaerobaculia bacterium]